MPVEKQVVKLSEDRYEETRERFSRDYHTDVQRERKKWEVKVPTTRAQTNVDVISTRSDSISSVEDEVG